MTSCLWITHLQAVGCATTSPSPVKPLPSLFAGAGRHQASGEIVVKVVNVAATEQPVRVVLTGVAAVVPTARVDVLAHPDAEAENSVEAPGRVVPVTGSVAGVSTDFVHTVPAHSVTVLRLAPR
jgi:alpha-L-arabinofuranosidase